MAETAVVILLPELEPLIGGWRRRYTGDGARGMPPHVTLIIPFADSADLDDRLGPLGRALAAFAPFDVCRHGKRRGFEASSTSGPSRRSRSSR